MGGVFTIMKRFFYCLLLTVLLCSCTVTIYAEDVAYTKENPFKWHNLHLDTVGENLSTSNYVIDREFDEFIYNLGKEFETDSDYQDMYLWVKKIESNTYFWTENVVIDTEVLPKLVEMEFGFTVSTLQIVKKLCGGVSKANVDEEFLYESYKSGDTIKVIEYYTANPLTDQFIDFSDLTNTYYNCGHLAQSQSDRYTLPTRVFMEMGREYIVRLNPKNHYTEDTCIGAPIKFFIYNERVSNQGYKSPLSYGNYFEKDIPDIDLNGCFLKCEAIDFNEEAYRYTCYVDAYDYNPINDRQRYLKMVNDLWKELNPHYPFTADAGNEPALYIIIGVEGGIILILIVALIALIVTKSKNRKNKSTSTTLSPESDSE